MLLQHRAAQQQSNSTIGAPCPGASSTILPDPGLVTCLFSFGSAGASKPLWFDAERWAEWGERNPPSSRRARTALARRSVRVSCAALIGPLSHGMARRTAWSELQHGGRIGLCSPRGTGGGSQAPDDKLNGGSDGSLDILDQIALIAPTQLSAAPRFYVLYQRRYEMELLAAKLAATPLPHTALAAISDTALAAVRHLGGPRLRFVAVGGAVVPPALLNFLRECFGTGGSGGGRAIVSNGYAMAEVPGGIARDGVPVPGVQLKLLPRKDAGEGEGEILVKTSRGVIVGSEGGASLDADGWFHTGDLGRWVEQEGGRRLQVIDRSLNLHHLSPCCEPLL